MTNFHLASDLHLGFGDMELPGGSNLILAGDILEATAVGKNSKLAELFARFLKVELAKYTNVVYVLGNHEHYGFEYFKTKKFLEQNLPSNVQILEKETTVIDGVRIFGATMWTDFDRDNPVAIHAARNGMNDFRHIRHITRKFTPDQAAEEFRLTIAELEEVEADLVVTHHAPSFKSVPPEFASSILNAAYASNLDDFILDSNIKVWCHGHIHTPQDYMIGNTRILANPRGYAGYETLANHFKVLEFNV